MSLIIRVLGIAVGLVMLLMGGWLIYKPVFDNMLESLNAVAFILLGFLFIYYGITGRGNLFRK